MPSYFDYLDHDFNKPEDGPYRSREYVFVKCPLCHRTGKKLLSNLKVQIKKIGEYRCKSCSSSLGSRFGPLRPKVETKLDSFSGLIYTPIRGGFWNMYTKFQYECLECSERTITSLGNFVKDSFTGLCKSCGIKNSKGARNE